MVLQPKLEIQSVELLGVPVELLGVPVVCSCDTVAVCLTQAAQVQEGAPVQVHAGSQVQVRAVVQGAEVAPTLSYCEQQSMQMQRNDSDNSWSAS